MVIVDQDAFPNLAHLTGEILSSWPEHSRYLEKSLSGRDPALLRHSERLSKMIVRLARAIDGGLPTLARDYRFLCEQIVLPEELHFRRHDRYRLDNFEDAYRL